MSGGDFPAAVAALQRAGGDGDLCEPFLSVFPVRHAAISTLGDPFGSETVTASGAPAARWDEIQIDLGEGPAWEAMRSHVPVLEPRLQTSGSARWPIALMAMRETHVGSVFAFPMHVGALSIGAVDMYDRNAVTFPAAAVQYASVMTDLVARFVLRRALLRAESADPVQEQEAGRYSRRAVHQASGMLAAQAGVTVDDALLLLRAFAYTADRSVQGLSSDIVTRRIDLPDHDTFNS
ncbi:MULTISPECIES: GAF and ANTAR domain-containing protein [unclassified Curtobacterium]|uniref:GAF and ANTAR domain-containing protein n=1 Tax=unclassified Curtobacterium TaxID=257496 RepID=UPI00226B9FB4|nr:MULTISPECIES: GAF and ANTAR domain-containing protein [unclassified Curtobacterium]